MSKLEIEAIRVFISDMRHARKVKYTLVRLCQEEPEKVLQAIEQLEEKDQKYLSWVKRLAHENLTM